jgi:hypothetical protein
MLEYIRNLESGFISHCLCVCVCVCVTGSQTWNSSSPCLSLVLSVGIIGVCLWVFVVILFCVLRQGLAKKSKPSSVSDDKQQNPLWLAEVGK